MVLESLALPQSPGVRATILLTLGELAPFLPSNFHIEWSSMEWSFTGHLVKSVELSGLSNFDVYLQVQLSEEEGEQLLGGYLLTRQRVWRLKMCLSCTTIEFSSWCKIISRILCCKHS